MFPWSLDIRLLLADPNELTWSDLLQRLEHFGDERSEDIETIAHRDDDDHRYLATLETLLVHEVLIDGHEGVELALGEGEQLPVAVSGPP